MRCVPAAMLLTGAIIGAFAWLIHASPREVAAGGVAPSFRLPMARGGICDLADLLAKRRVVLLSFLDARAQPLSRAHGDPSRGQLVFLKSMTQQYASRGLAVLIIGCNGLASGTPLARGVLLNFTYDWQLDGVAVLWDDDEGVARQYGVSRLPTTFLISPDGCIRRRWNGFVASAPLALAIESLVGPPRYRH